MISHTLLKGQGENKMNGYFGSLLDLRNKNIYIYIYIYITTFRTYLTSFFFDEKISIKGRKSYSKVQTASPNYIQSKCIRVLTTGGETPLHKWHTLLHRANLASSCASLLKSLFRCRICQQAKPSRRPTIPLTMWPKPPPKSLDKMHWTIDKESDSMMSCWRSNSLARRIPASIAKASVSSTAKQLGRTRQRAAAAWPLQSLTSHSLFWNTSH